MTWCWYMSKRRTKQATRGNPEHKKKAIELIDKFIVGPVYEVAQTYEAFRILVMPDHPTPGGGTLSYR